MSTTSDLVLRLSNLVGYGWGDVNSNLATPDGGVPSAYYFCHDAWGARILQYVRNRNGSDIVMGELMSYESDGAQVLTTTKTVTSGTKTSGVTSGLTAGDHDGKICYVLTNGDSGNAAPEGESSIVAINGTTLITMESAYPFTTALANNDVLELIATYQVEDSADADEAFTVAGVVLGRDGIDDGSYGWIQKEGYISALSTGTAIAEGDNIESGVALIDVLNGGLEISIGVALATQGGSETFSSLPVNLKLVTFSGTVGTP